MHHPTDRITHTTAFVTPVVEHWLEREIAQWVGGVKNMFEGDMHSGEQLSFSTNSASCSEQNVMPPTVFWVMILSVVVVSWCGVSKVVVVSWCGVSKVVVVSWCGVTKVVVVWSHQGGCGVESPRWLWCGVSKVVVVLWCGVSKVVVVSWCGVSKVVVVWSLQGGCGVVVWSLQGGCGVESPR